MLLFILWETVVGIYGQNRLRLELNHADRAASQAQG